MAVALSQVSVFILDLAPHHSIAGEHAWTGTIPPIAQDQTAWPPLLDALLEEKMYFGAAAAARRMTTFFQEITVREKAYRSLAQLTNIGYPISLRAIFSSSDLEPDPGNINSAEDYEFVNTYYLYKLMSSESSHLTKWASDFLSRIDQKHHPRYLFYRALQAYEKNDLKGAVEQITEILELIKSNQNDLIQMPSLFFMKTVLRTLARIYFEQENYEKSLEIYEAFLLKLNPIVPMDYLEAAWDYYYLKKYDQALGALYNLESKAGQQLALSLEKYSLRALIYRESCAVPQIDSLIRSYQQAFGSWIALIKNGKSYNTSLGLLNRIQLDENSSYRQTSIYVDNLVEEQTKISSLPKKIQFLAGYLYSSELTLSRQQLLTFRDQATTSLATQLISIEEQMKFLSFDITRSKYNPDNLFKEDDIKSSVVKPGAEDTFEIHWGQYGDFWMDERNNYKGLLINRCAH